MLPPELGSGYEIPGRIGTGFIVPEMVINKPGLWNVFNTVSCWVRDFLLNTLIPIWLVTGHLKASVFRYADNAAGDPGAGIAGRL